jgi:hypothetical protein
MSHENIQEKISQFMDNELPKEQHREMYMHLSECEECREYFAGTMRIHDAVKTLTNESFPADMDRKFSVLRLGNADHPYVTQKMLVSIPSALLTVIAAFLIGFSLLFSFQTLSGPEPDRFQQTFNDHQFFNSQVPLRN